MNTQQNKRRVTQTDIAFTSGVVLKRGTTFRDKCMCKNGARITEIKLYANHVLDDEKQWHGEWSYDVQIVYDAPNAMYDTYRNTYYICMGHADRTYRNISGASYARLRRVTKTHMQHTIDNPYPICARWVACDV